MDCVTRQSSEVHSHIFLQHLVCVFSLCLLLCSKTSKERNHNTGASNVSAAMFLLGSNSFQRNDRGTSVCFLFRLPKGCCCRETSSARKCKLTSACCHHFCMLCCLCLESLCVFLLFPHPKKHQKSLGKQVLGGEEQVSATHDSQ